VSVDNVGYRDVRQDIGIGQSVNVGYGRGWGDVRQRVEICRGVAIEIVAVRECSRSELRIM